MPTVTKALADKIVAADGHYSDDPRVHSIVEYTDMGGQLAYGMNYRVGHNAYTESPYVQAPRLYWSAGDTARIGTDN